MVESGFACQQSPMDGCSSAAEPFQQWVDCESDRLRGIIRGAIGRRAAKGAETEDLLQEVWVRVFSKLDTLKARDLPGVRCWLTRIARNCCHDALRRAGHARWSAGPEAEASLPSADDTGQEGEGHDSRSRILTRLAPDERIVLWLRGTQGLGWETVRLVLRKPSVRIARTLYARARHRVPVLGSLY